MWSSWSFCGVGSKRLLVDSWASTMHASFVFWICWIHHFRLRFPAASSSASFVTILQSITASIGISNFFHAMLMVFSVLSIFRIDETNASPSSSVLDLRLFNCPFVLLLLLSCFWHATTFQASKIRSCSCMIFCKPHPRESCPWIWQTSIHVDIPKNRQYGFLVSHPDLWKQSWSRQCVECIPSIRGQEMKLVSSRIHKFHQFLPHWSHILLSSSHFLSSTHTDENDPCFRWTNKSLLIRYFFSNPSPTELLELPYSQEASKWMSVQMSFKRTTGSSMFDHDFGQCVSWETYPYIYIHGHYDAGILSNLGASANLAWV